MNARQGQQLAAAVVTSALLLPTGCTGGVSDKPGRVIAKRMYSCPWVKIRHDDLATTRGCIDKARWNAARRGDRWPPKTGGAK